MPRVAAFLEGCAEVSYLDYVDVPYAHQGIELSASVEIACAHELALVVGGARIFSLECNHGFPAC